MKFTTVGILTAYTGRFLDMGEFHEYKNIIDYIARDYYIGHPPNYNEAKVRHILEQNITWLNTAIIQDYDRVITSNPDKDKLKQELQTLAKHLVQTHGEYQEF